MKKFSIFLFLFALGEINVHGATHNVPPGHSIQAAINGASTGDNLIIWQGVYDEDLVISGKALTLRPLNDGEVQVRSVTANNAGGIVRLSNLRVMTDVNATKSSLHLFKCYILGDVTVADAVDDANNDLQSVILQTTIREHLTCRAKRSWICYNTIRNSYLEGDTEVTGNEFHGRGGGGIGIDVNGTATHALIRNNQIHQHGLGAGGTTVTEECIGIRVNGGAKADIINNVIYECYLHQRNGSDSGMGIFVKSTTGTTIMGNALWKCYVNGQSGNSGDVCVSAPFANVILKYNLMGTSTFSAGIVRGGVINYESLTLPHNAAAFDNNGQPTANYVGSNAGPPDARYNDHDGTRNDIGLHGGHGYLPDGRTTDKPIPIQLSTTPAFVPIGGTVTIESTGATVK